MAVVTPAFLTHIYTIKMEYTGPFLGKTFLIVVDVHSKWPEVIEMTSTTASKTITELRKLFSAYGLPEQLVSDNGPQFVSEEFGTFLKLGTGFDISVAHPTDIQAGHEGWSYLCSTVKSASVQLPTDLPSHSSCYY